MQSIYFQKFVNDVRFISDGTALKMKFSIKDFFRKCDQICRFQRIWSHLLKKSFMEKFIFCVVWSVDFGLIGESLKIQFFLIDSNRHFPKVLHKVLDISSLWTKYHIDFWSIYFFETLSLSLKATLLWSWMKKKLRFECGDPGEGMEFWSGTFTKPFSSIFRIFMTPEKTKEYVRRTSTCFEKTLCLRRKDFNTVDVMTHFSLIFYPEVGL